ncbi:SRPBCC family protein [Streptomyces sp. 8ZJF_21]|uniref:SRPBCC family protein n=1 Tax=Streptomyces sp. 8ZJF_21 TaxID=2903141 RepID=UPI001E34CBEB|nr:SRPBCC family protein [Streptomyces sp. 8ZJF_21]MCD9592766.1 SRPBCC domain-containing protein [Streptomyces sp. 8ZJF_21]
MKDTLAQTGGGRSALRLERRLAHPPEKVWRALTEPAQLAHWFPSEVRIELKSGGRMGFVFPGREAPDMDGVITELDPPHVFAFTWGEDELRWELRPEGDGCVLTLTHTFGDRFGAASFASGWHACITGLAALLGGEEIAHGDMAELHEQYVEAFGLAEGTVETIEDGGWRLRFERQLVRPAETVWRALTGPAADTPEPAAGAPVPFGFRTDAVPAGPITEARPPRVLAYEWERGGRPAGTVRWELTEGTGHGARLILTQTGPAAAEAERAEAQKAWRHHIGLLAAKLLRIRS